MMDFEVFAGLLVFIAVLFVWPGEQPLPRVPISDYTVVLTKFGLRCEAGELRMSGAGR
jgi:hypothetical protein